MNGSDAGRSAALDAYLSRLEAELAPLPDPDRRDVVLETRSHIVERMARSPRPDVDAVLAELGPPTEYARRFLPERAAPPSPAPLRRRSALTDLARLTAGRWTTIPLLLVVIGAYGIVALALLIAVGKLLEPNATGLFIDYANGHRSLNFVISNPNAKGRDLLGYWLVPIMLLVSLALHLGVRSLLGRFLRADERARAEG